MDKISKMGLSDGLKRYLLHRQANLGCNNRFLVAEAANGDYLLQTKAAHSSNILCTKLLFPASVNRNTPAYV